MATATGKPETVVKSAYLSKAHVAHINDLNYETANQMIVLVTGPRQQNTGGAPWMKSMN